ncbi:hypothetical protein ABMA28_015981 [Loxostege sticticalis]|uniref:Carboxylic ester hydrolase n=1 Tax=Loxostege sticticalis TaxID=481309 RepID=A0ABD0T7F9_LOXSC
MRDLFILCSLILSLQNVCGSVSPIVESGVGQIRGHSAPDGNYSMFLGIPYATLDVNNPFGHSKPYPKFEGIFNAYNDSTICPHVYVPKTASGRNKLPVMVWLHEGGFFRGYIGRNTMKAKYLMRQDIILVMPNYRLGPYGFMCLDIPEVPGNQGLKDQVIALKWIKDNIESFGGDANRVTLFGSSAGAISIDFHFMFTDEQLFHRAILQSGSSVSSTVISLPDKKAPLKLAETLGMSTDSLTEALSFLATVDTKAVIIAGLRLDMLFKPCIEKRFDGVEPFITESWINVKKPKVKGKEVMLGFVEYEKVYEFVVEPDKYINSIDIFRTNLLSTFDFSDQNLTKMRNLVKQFYLGDKQISEDDIMPLIEFLSDFTYVYSMRRALKQYQDGDAKQIYHYVFSYVGGRNYHQLRGNFTFEGAVHADELGYLFDYVFLPLNVTPEDQLTINRITTLWANFAKNGNPTPETTNLLPVKWIPVSKDYDCYLKIGYNLTMEDSIFHQRMAFWDLFYMLNEKSQKFYSDINKSTILNLTTGS